MAKVNYTGIKRKVVDLLAAQAVPEGSLEGVTVFYGPRRASAKVCPYVSVYGAQITRAGRRIGGTRPRDTTLTIMLDCVTFSAKSFEESDDLLMDLVDAVEEILDSHETLDGLAILSEIGDIDLDEDSSTGFFSGATITLRIETRR